MITLLEVLQKSTQFLSDRGVADAKLSAEWIMASSLGLQRLELYLQFERPLSDQELSGIRSGVKRRANREPLQYILGNTDFYNVKLKTDARALIPRPETEYLIELLHTKYLNKEPTRILDLGTGSGAIAVALLSAFPNATVVAVDKSVPALELAAENAEAAGVSERIRCLQSDWFENVEGTFELILANSPYLTAEEMESAEPEVVKYEPRTALFGGTDGLDDLNRIVDEGLSYLVDGGMLVLETGIKHHTVLMKRAEDVGYVTMQSVKDIERRDRFLIGIK